MEEILITGKSQNDSVSSSVDDKHTETIEKNQPDLLEQELFKGDKQVREEPEITREQLALSKKLLNWRTLVPLVIVIAAIAFFVRQEHIDPQKTWTAIRSANFIFLLAAFVIYYLSFLLLDLRWRLLIEHVGY